MSFGKFAQTSCGVPLSNWEIARQVGYGSLVAAAVILSVVFMIYMFCTSDPFSGLPSVYFWSLDMLTRFFDRW